MADLDDKGSKSREFEACLEDIRRKFGDASGTVEIERRPPGSTRFFDLPSEPLQNFNPNQLVRQYGGGAYKFHIRNPAGQFVSHYEKEYDPSIKAAEEPKPAPATAAPAPAAAPALDMTALISMMTAQSQQTMTMMSSMMTAVVQAVGNRPSGPSMAEILAMVKSMKDLAGDGNNKPDAALLRVVMDSALKMQERMPDRSDGIEGALLAEGIRAIRSYMEKLPAPGAATPAAPQPVLPPPAAQPPAAASPAPAPAPAPAAPAKVPGAPPAIPPGKYQRIKTIIVQAAPTIYTRIKEGASPKETADQVLDVVPPGLYDELHSFANEPDAVDQIYALYSPLMSEIPWLKEFVSTIRTELVSEPKDVGGGN